MARAPARWQPLLVALVVVPFWTSFLIRIYAWIAILKPEGLLNAGLLRLGLIAQPLEHPEHRGRRPDRPRLRLPALHGAAALRGAEPAGSAPARGGGRPRRRRRPGCSGRVTLPLARPGSRPGRCLCFIPMVGEFVIPDLLGGSDTLMLGRVLWSEFFSNRDWPLASAVAILILAIVRRAAGAVPRGRARRAGDGRPVSWRSTRTALIARARLPLRADPGAGRLLLQRLARWSRSGAGSRRAGTARCCRDAPLHGGRLGLAARWPLLAARIATVLGTLAALALDAHGRFRGRPLFTGLIYAPMVMPEVMTGLSLLLLFVGVGLDRGLVTIVIAHATFGPGFVAVVVGGAPARARPVAGGGGGRSRRAARRGSSPPSPCR